MEYRQLFFPDFGDLRLTNDRLKGAMVAFRRMKVKRETVEPFLFKQEQHWQRKAVVTKNGKTIVTFQPSRELKRFQWRIVRYIERVNRGQCKTILPLPKTESTQWERNIVSSRFATAFSKGDSVVRNALAHLDMRSCVSFDLRRAFENIKRKHVQRFLKRFGFPNDVAWTFSKLLTHKGRLQRGASCSPQIFNLLLARLDTQIAEAVGAVEPEYHSREWADKKEREDRFGWNSREWLDRIRSKRMSYTRYGDDICVSSVEEFPPHLVTAIRNIILSEGFQIRETKTRVCQNGVLELPGAVIVGNVVRPRKSYLIRLARLIAAGSLSEKQLHGHLAFICSFPLRGRKGAYSFLKKTLGNGTKLPVLRRPSEPLF